MDRFQPISITNSSLGAHLYPSEEVFLLTGNVGLYSGPYKSIPHAGGTVYLTSHRLFYIDDTNPHSHSCFLALDLIRETQYYAGFLKSSPKVTVGFDKVIEEDDDGKQSKSNRDTSSKKDLNGGDWREGATVPENEGQGLATKTWICRICAFSNTIGSTDSSLKEATVKCQLCGVTSEIKDLVVEETRTKAKSKTNGALAPSTPAKDSRNGISCPTCTFANHPSMSRCEMCDTLLGTIDPAQLKPPAPTRRSEETIGSRVQTPEEREEERHNRVRLSFRKGGDKAFYSTLKATLQEKRWQNKISTTSNGTTASSRNRFSSQHRNIDGRSASSALNSDNGGDVSAVKRVGIEGIFSQVDLQARGESDEMKDAFRDLEALMNRAKKMVDLAETLNAKLTRQEAAAAATGKGVEGTGDQQNIERATIIRSSLVRLGLPTPAITLDMAKDEMEYNMQLARELAGLLYTGSSPLMGKGRVVTNSINNKSKVQDQLNFNDTNENRRGIMPLDELWCMWNRARGVALVSPACLLAVCKILPTITLPQIDCKTFQSGIRVLHTSKYQSSRFSLRVLSFLGEKKREAEEEPANIKDHIGKVGATTLEIAKKEDCPLYLVNELLTEVEYEIGTIVRDDNGQVSWYENEITQFSWDRWLDHRNSSHSISS